MSKWYIGAGEQSDIVISTRIRLARNADEYPFPAKLDVKSRTALNKKICDALLNDSEYPLSYIEMKTLTQAEAVSLAERHLISPEFASSTDGRGLLLSENEEISIMLCEEDHIRIQVIKTGFAPEEAYKIADALDNKLNAQIQYAFDERLGYLTQCPTNLGTGMRASVMLHLARTCSLQPYQPYCIYGVQAGADHSRCIRRGYGGDGRPISAEQSSYARYFRKGGD